MSCGPGGCACHLAADAWPCTFSTCESRYLFHAKLLTSFHGGPGDLGDLRLPALLRLAKRQRPELAAARARAETNLAQALYEYGVGPPTGPGADGVTPGSALTAGNLPPPKRAGALLRDPSTVKPRPGVLRNRPGR